MDLVYLGIDAEQFPVMDWKEFYGEVTKPIPPNAPKPLGKPVDVSMFIDSATHVYGITCLSLKIHQSQSPP